MKLYFNNNNKLQIVKDGASHSHPTCMEISLGHQTFHYN